MSENKIGRNDNCPCGSGLKYKRCCIKTHVDLTEEELIKSGGELSLIDFGTSSRLDGTNMEKFGLVKSVCAHGVIIDEKRYVLNKSGRYERGDDLSISVHYCPICDGDVLSKCFNCETDFPSIDTNEALNRAENREFSIFDFLDELVCHQCGANWQTPSEE